MSKMWDTIPPRKYLKMSNIGLTPVNALDKDCKTMNIPWNKDNRNANGCQVCGSPCAKCGHFRYAWETFLHIFDGECFCNSCEKLMNPNIFHE